MDNIRVRFAPSPTGPLHIGGVRTALYNYLFAKQHKGELILRIEDTDQTRFVEGAEAYIQESLNWIGIEFDEGVKEGGNFGPYRQSERTEIYQQHIQQLLDKGLAYYAFDTPDELEEMREKQKEKGVPTPQYDVRSRMGMKNSLTIPKEQLDQLINEGVPYVIRIKMPESTMIKFNDVIRGDIEVESHRIDDKVLFKSDGLPTYHFANIVDDHLMNISHVIRGEEWLPSAPLHVYLYECFGWEAPQFAHLPLLLKPSGQGKLSKRDGDKLGFPVFPIEWTDPKTDEKSMGYRESGYFSQAVVNILAFLGWNPGTEQEFFTMNELIQAFSLDKVGKSGSKFDPEKAKWFNQHYLRMQKDEDLAISMKRYLAEKSVEVDESILSRVAAIMKERAVFVADLVDQSLFFFVAPTTYDPKVVKKRWKENTPGMMKSLIALLNNVDIFQSELLETKVKSWIQEKELSMGAVLNALRLCLVGASAGPHVFDIMDILGKEETINRIQTAIEQL